MKEGLGEINSILYGVIKNRDNKLSVNEAHRLERWDR